MKHQVTSTHYVDSTSSTSFHPVSLLSDLPTRPSILSPFSIQTNPKRILSTSFNQIHSYHSHKWPPMVQRTLTPFVSGIPESPSFPPSSLDHSFFISLAASSSFSLPQTHPRTLTPLIIPTSLVVLNTTCVLTTTKFNSSDMSSKLQTK